MKIEVQQLAYFGEREKTIESEVKVMTKNEVVELAKKIGFDEINIQKIENLEPGEVHSIEVPTGAVDENQPSYMGLIINCPKIEEEPIQTQIFEEAPTDALQIKEEINLKIDLTDIQTKDIKAVEELIVKQTEKLTNLVIPESVEELSEMQSWLKEEHDNLNSTRKEIFKNTKGIEKLIIGFENLIKLKTDEIKNIISELQKEEREKIEHQRKNVVSYYYIANVSDKQKKDEFFKNFWENLIDDLKTKASTLTATGKITKKASEEILMWSEKHETALNVLEEIGLSRYKSNNFDLVDAQAFQNEQKELMAKQIEKERIESLEKEAREKALAAEEEKAGIKAREEIQEEIEQVKIEKEPEITTEAPQELFQGMKQVVVKFTYSEENGPKLNEIIRQLGEYATIEVIK